MIIIEMESQEDEVISMFGWFRKFVRTSVTVCLRVRARNDFGFYCHNFVCNHRKLLAIDSMWKIRSLTVTR